MLGGEGIDLSLDEKLAIEVKETFGPSDLKKLRGRAASIEIPESCLIGGSPHGSDFRDFVWGRMW
jgi:hypothetical protein